MTMVIWAACDNFALMMADRRAFTTRCVRSQDGGTTFGDLALGPDVTKAVLSGDMRDIFAVAGTSPADQMASRVAALHGIDADKQLLLALLPQDPVAQAIDPNLLGLTNAVLHAYTRHGRMVCCRTQWTPSWVHREIMVGSRERIALGVAGSGGALLMNREVSLPEEMFILVDDWRALRPHLDELFRVVASRDPAVGPDADIWSLVRGETSWRRENAGG